MLRDYAAYFRAIRERFEDAVFGEQTSTCTDPVEHCALGYDIGTKRSKNQVSDVSVAPTFERLPR